jgi:hypothetical protein
MVANIEMMIDVTIGKAHVKFSRTILISPGKFPKCRPNRSAKYKNPPITKIDRPRIMTILLVCIKIS